MGDTISTDISSVERADLYYNGALQNNFLPDFGIDQTFQKFSFANSDRILQQHFASKLATANMLYKVPQYFKDVTTALGPITKAPNSMGLGAVVISFILDLAIGPEPAADRTDEIPGMLQRVFNDEKSKAILVTLDYYMKQHRIHIHDAAELMEIAKLNERQLSVQLTALRHTMHTEMRTRHLKHWVNGAAFHVLLLAHIANMKHSECGNCSAVLQKAPEIAVDEYLRKLPGLLDKYRQYKLETITFKNLKTSYCANYGCATVDSSRCEIKDNELQNTMTLSCPGYHRNIFFNLDVNGMVMHQKKFVTRILESQITGLTTYFTHLKSSLPSLVARHGVFRLPTCREVQRTYQLYCD